MLVFYYFLFFFTARMRAGCILRARAAVGVTGSLLGRPRAASGTNSGTNPDAIQAAAGLPLDLYMALQVGATPPLTTTRAFLLAHFSQELFGGPPARSGGAASGHATPRRVASHAALLALDARRTAALLRRCLHDRFLSVPFRCFSLDLEFTGAPRFTALGPSEEIIELSLYHPESREMFATLVRPRRRPVSPEAGRLTGITPAMLGLGGPSSGASSGGRAGRNAAVQTTAAVPTFEDAWAAACEFLHRPRAGEAPGSGANILLLSHGGQLADFPTLEWALGEGWGGGSGSGGPASEGKTSNAAPETGAAADVPSAAATGDWRAALASAAPGRGPGLPPSVRLGDSLLLCRDVHRRRPVTEDRQPPGWGLEDLAAWLRLPRSSDDPFSTAAGFDVGVGDGAAADASAGGPRFFDAAGPVPEATVRAAAAAAAGGAALLPAAALPAALQTTPHRAAADARRAWAVLEATLERYGDDALSARRQLVARYYNDAARAMLGAAA